MWLFPHSYEKRDELKDFSLFLACRSRLNLPCSPPNYKSVYGHRRHGTARREPQTQLDRWKSNQRLTHAAGLIMPSISLTNGAVGFSRIYIRRLLARFAGDVTACFTESSTCTWRRLLLLLSGASDADEIPLSESPQTCYCVNAA